MTKPLYSIVFFVCITFVETTPVGDQSEVELIYENYEIANNSEISIGNISLRYSPDMHDALDYSNLDYHDETESSGMEDLFQGDMKINDPEKFFSDAYDRTSISKRRRLWPGGVVPFIVDDAFDARERSIISKAMESFHEKTCLKFISRTNQEDYLHLVKGEGCWSYWGRIRTGKQEISLGNGCVYKGIVLHELMHTAGFVHEHNRPDRDMYLEINWDAIKPGKSDNFNKLSWSVVTSLGVSYDYVSIMHYGRYTFAKDKERPTITPKFRTARMGQRQDLSSKDVIKLNLLYNCKRRVRMQDLAAPAVAESTFGNEVTETCMDLTAYCPWLRVVYGFQCQQGAWMAYNCPSTCGMCG
ncbi:hatching enzyme 1.2-like isoform X2 [Palaemon carinicauda]|uniref:hatching enzyme 1.2-like isoform X2 n=1 Tax=Palaemon carinicauda TaxID=392227 RepID=UPI0035B68594